MTQLGRFVRVARRLLALLSWPSARAVALPACALLACALAPRIAHASGETPTDKTLSPYFVVEGADPNVEALPLESTKVDVQITGVIAEVTVTQAYKNAGKKPINAQAWPA